MSERRIPRRSFLAAGTATVAACRAADSQYFGRSIPPSDQRLICENDAELGSIDPAQSVDIWEAFVVHSLFEGLTTYHPRTCAPMAGLATHYELDARWFRYTFYLRGHPNPRGHKLSNTGTLRQEYQQGKLSQDLSRGLSPPPDTRPAVWSDGKVITAEDFVGSWRRAVDPRTAGPEAYPMSCVQNADAILAGREGIDALGVEAHHKFTFVVTLQRRTPFFLQLISHRLFCAVPIHVLNAGRSSGRESDWTEPGHIVTSGPFTLHEWRPNERLVIVRNPNYYESDLVSLRQISFLPVTANTASLNLYKAGEADSTMVLLPQMLPVLRRKRDFSAVSSLDTALVVINTTKAPLDNIFVRYALNMATDKAAIAEFMGGRTPTSTLIPHLDGYRSPESLQVSDSGKVCDVLSFDPEGARHMLAKAGFVDGVGSDGRRLKIEISINTAPDGQFIAQILQQQWRRHLGIDANVVMQELKAWLHTIFNKSYKGVAFFLALGRYVDPTSFLNRFTTGADALGTGWADPKFDALLAQASESREDSERMQRLTECEAYLLEGMPFIPLYRWAWCRLEKAVRTRVAE